MKDKSVQLAECGVAFVPDLIAGRPPMVLVSVERGFQALELHELRVVDTNLHTAFKLAALFSRRERIAQEAVRA